MREIKLRVWDRSSRVWIQEPFSIYWNDAPTVTVNFKTKGHKGYDRMLVVGESCDLVEYTGLKDKNGKEIFEGDLLECFEVGRPPVKGIVKFSDGVFELECFCSRPMGTYPLRDQLDYGQEVISNIYENPELVKIS